MTGPDGAPVEGSRFAANRPLFRRGFYISCRAPQHRGARGAEENVDDGVGSREDFALAQGQRRRLPSRPLGQGLRRFPPFRRAAAVTCRPSLVVPARGPRAAQLSGSGPAVRLEGSPPRRGPGPSYRMSRPRGRGIAPGPKSSELLEAENKGSRSDAGGLPQRTRQRYAFRRPNNRRHRPQQPPGAHGQNPEGGEGKIPKGPAGKPACVAKKSSTSEEDATVADATSAAQAQ